MLTFLDNLKMLALSGELLMFSGVMSSGNTNFHRRGANATPIALTSHEEPVFLGVTSTEN